MPWFQSETSRILQSESETSRMPWFQRETSRILQSESETSRMPWFKSETSPVIQSKNEVSHMSWFQSETSHIPQSESETLCMPWYQSETSRTPWLQNEISQMPWCQSETIRILQSESETSRMPWFQRETSCTPWLKSEVSQMPWCQSETFQWILNSYWELLVVLRCERDKPLTHCLFLAQIVLSRLLLVLFDPCVTMFGILQRELFDKDYWSAAWGNRENVIPNSNTIVTMWPCDHVTSSGKLRNRSVFSNGLISYEVDKEMAWCGGQRVW